MLLSVLHNFRLFFCIFFILFYIQITYSIVTISNDTIICCNPWDTIVNVKDINGAPMQNVKVYVRVLNNDGVEKEAFPYVTDSDGKVKIYYKPRMGEALEITINEPQMRYSIIIPVKSSEHVAINVGIIMGIGISSVLVIIILVVKGRLIERIEKIIVTMKEKAEKQKQKGFGFGSSASKNISKKQQESKWVFASSTTTKQPLKKQPGFSFGKPKFS